MSINAILAVDNNMGIGYKNSLPWPHNKVDMKWFSDCTTGQVIIMGKNTWESFGNKSLPNRINIVVSSKKPEGKPTTWYGGDIEMILEEIKEDYPNLNIFVIGGANLYSQALPYCNRIYITLLKKSYRCDTFINSQYLKDFSILEYFKQYDDMNIQIRRKHETIS